MTPTIYTPETVKAVLDGIASGKSMTEVCAADGMPSRYTVLGWIRTKPEFCEEFKAARIASMELLADDLIGIADDGTNDWMERRGMMVVDNEAIQRSKLRVDTRKWVLAKMLPKVYGDNSSVNLKHDDALDDLTDEQLAERIALIEKRLSEKRAAAGRAEAAPATATD